MTVDFVVLALYSYVIERRLSVMLLYRDLCALIHGTIVCLLYISGFCTGGFLVTEVSRNWMFGSEIVPRT